MNFDSWKKEAGKKALHVIYALDREDWQYNIHVAISGCVYLIAEANIRVNTNH